MARVCLAVERLIWRAQKASRAEVVGSAAVNYIERREEGGETIEKPFNSSQKAKTMEKYGEVCGGRTDSTPHARPTRWAAQKTARARAPARRTAGTGTAEVEEELDDVDVKEGVVVAETVDGDLG